MEIFTRPLAGYAKQFADEGWLYLPDAVHPAFVRYALGVLERADRGEPALPSTSVGGQKDHRLFEFPKQVAYTEDFVLPISRLCGFDVSRFTLAQRHVMRYRADAKPMPKPHKDRCASAVSIGMPLHVPASSRLVLYPSDDVGENPFMSTDLRRSMPAGQLPENTLEQWRAVEITDAPGDLVVFRGSRMWHSRRNPQGAAHLYLMVNDELLDPLGEDPWAGLNRKRSQSLDALDEVDRDITVLIPGRRLDTLSVHRHRNGELTRSALVWPDTTVYLTGPEEQLVRNLNSGVLYKDIDNLIRCGFAGHGELEAAVYRLLAEGVVDAE